MGYIVINSFDEGKGMNLRGQEYTGDNAAALLKAGLIGPSGKAKGASEPVKPLTAMGKIASKLMGKDEKPAPKKRGRPPKTAS